MKVDFVPQFKTHPNLSKEKNTIKTFAFALRCRAPRNLQKDSAEVGLIFIMFSFVRTPYLNSLKKRESCHKIDLHILNT